MDGRRGRQIHRPFYLAQGNIYDIQQIAAGGKVIEPAEQPVRDGYTFGGWYNGEFLWNFNSPVTGNLSLTAKWTTTAVETPFVVNGTVANAPAGTTVHLYRYTGLKASVPAGYEWTATIATDATGRYQFGNLPEGQYIVVIEMAGYESQPSQPITLAAGKTEGNVNFTVNNDTHTVTPGDVATGVGETLQITTNLYPNPFAGTLHLTGAEGCTLQVITAGGAVVHTQKVVNPDETISLEKLPAGVYFFRLEKDGKAKTVKGVKR
jgi:uncharacterized repeat protein (TIGR02543 family)